LRAHVFDRLAPVIVVPDGLSRDLDAGSAAAEPSFVFRAVLDRTAATYRLHRILVAPGNRFGAPASEHDMARAWLLAHGCGDVETVGQTPGGYIDTWGNAVVLRDWLAARHAWPIGPCILVVAFRHARRAELCFRRNGYDIALVDRVRYEVGNVPIVPRLFYYRIPWLHRCYEAVALVRDRFRPASTPTIGADGDR
jgi:uncharacterized SAM-binding protein YcdF (DUF218 family)